MIKKDIKEVKYSRSYGISVDETGEINTEDYKLINNDLSSGFKLVKISGGSKMFNLELEKVETIDYIKIPDYR